MEIFNKKLGIVLIILVFGAVIYWFSVHYFIQQEIESFLEIQESSRVALEEILEERVLYVINKGEGNVRQYRLVPSQGSTAFSLLEGLAQRENFEIESTLYEGMGVFVESIDGVKNGTAGKYWQYWVNDELPPVASDKKKVKEGDKVEWKFEVPLEF